jgi:hypothetical protein
MFNAHKLETAVILLNNFPKHKTIKVQERTPLYELVNSVSHDGCKIDFSHPGVFVNDVLKLNSKSQFGDENITDTVYDLRMNNIVNQITTKLKEHINFLRTVVIPNISEFDSEIKNDIENMSDSELLNKDIIIEEMPEFILSKEFTNLYQNYLMDDRRLIDKMDDGKILKQNIFPKIDTLTLLSLIKSGNKELDDAVCSFLELNTTDGVDRAMSVYNLIFRGIETKNGIEVSSDRSFRSIFGSTKPDGLINCVIGFMIAFNQLINPAIDGIIANNTDFKMSLANTLNVIAFYFTSKVRNYNLNVNSGKLVLDVKLGTTIVNGPVYKDWIINHNGDTDVLLGNSTLDKPYYFLQDIIKNSDELLKRWKSYTAVIRSKENTVVYNYIKSRIITNLRNRLKIMAADRLITGQEADNRYQQTIREFDFITSKDLNENLSYILVRLMCKIIYPNTDTEYTASNMQLIAAEKDFSSDDEDASIVKNNINEAAFLAIFNYVTQWVSKQMTVTTVTQPKLVTRY